MKLSINYLSIQITYIFYYIHANSTLNCRQKQTPRKRQTKKKQTKITHKPEQHIASNLSHLLCLGVFGRQPTNHHHQHRPNPTAEPVSGSTSSLRCASTPTKTNQHSQKTYLASPFPKLHRTSPRIAFRGRFNAKHKMCSVCACVCVCAPTLALMSDVKNRAGVRGDPHLHASSGQHTHIL